MITKTGKLYIVATPIGNMKDITYRAIEVLNDVDIIAAEDTRNTIKILNHYNIKNKLVSYHEHNKYDKANEILKYLKEGMDVAIVTDAGTPMISDPGYELVKLCYDEKIEVTSVPGPTAIINAIVLSGFASNEFSFYGFLPVKQKDRKIKLEKIKNDNKLLVLYISPHKLLKDLSDLKEYIEVDRKIILLREMTKIYEERLCGNIQEIIDMYSERDIKGEFVLLIEANEKSIDDEGQGLNDMTIEEHYNYYKNNGFDDKVAIKMVARDRKIDKREVYKIIKI